jgi:hypothetical protein
MAMDQWVYTWRCFDVDSLYVRHCYIKYIYSKKWNYVKIEYVNLFPSLVTNFKPISLVPRLTEKRWEFTLKDNAKMHVINGYAAG